MSLSPDATAYFDALENQERILGIPEVVVNSRGTYSAHVSRLVEVRRGRVLHGVSGRGENIEDALANLWSNLTSSEGIVVSFGGRSTDLFWDAENNVFRLQGSGSIIRALAVPFAPTTRA